MSDKIKKQLEEKEKTFTLTDAEFMFLTHLDSVDRAQQAYLYQLKKDYLKACSMRFGYSMDDNLEVSVDLKDETHKLTVKKLD